MATAPFAFFADHHTDEPLRRAQAISAHLYRRSVVLTAHPGASGEVVRLPADDGDGAALPETGGQCPHVLHHAPLGVDALRRRAAMVTAWLAETRPAILVVDASVEIALLARLASQPAVVVRTHGARFDAAHLEAFRSADYLLAPFSACLEALETPYWVRDKTFYAGLICAADSDALPHAEPDPGDATRVVVAVLGSPTQTSLLAGIVRAARHAPDWHWRVIGQDPGPATPLPDNVELLGELRDRVPHLARADLVLGPCSAILVAEAAVTRRPMIALTTPAPHDAHRHLANALAEHELVDVCHDLDAVTDWPARLERVAATVPPWELAECQGSARRAALFIEAATAREHPKDDC